MAKTTTIPAVQNINNVDGVINNATGTAKVTVWTAGANDAVLKSLGLSSTDTVARVVTVYINIGGGGTDRIIGTISVPVASGTDGVTAGLDVLRSVLIPFLSWDAYGNRVFHVKAATTLKIACTTTVTAAKEIAAFGDGGDF